MWTKFKLYFHTIKYLKPIQIRYRLFYAIRRKLNLYRFLSKQKFQLNPRNLAFRESITSFPWEVKENTFEFLNQSFTFDKDGINWNYSEFGKLWTYNLNYFEFLHQEKITKEEGLRYIRDYIGQRETLIDGLEPYPISLRIIFWIRFIMKHEIQDDQINNILGKHLTRLFNHVEYHLLGNHLMENSFALIFGGLYFSNDTIFEKGKTILIKELKEQILDDGGHFEYSPMYHDILLYRLLDVYNLISANEVDHDFQFYLKANIQRMLSWSKQMTFSKGRRAYFNDTIAEIAPSFDQLSKYAKSLKIESGPQLPLSNSGFRKLQNEKAELIIDGGPAGASYIPGHSHNDALSFELYVNENPILVNTGISTYNNSDRRQLERSTLAHNTVSVEGKEQSEVWSAFRLARRSQSLIKIREEQKVEAISTNFVGKVHERTFTLSSSTLQIFETINGEFGIAAFHFHPSVSKETIKRMITFEGATSIQLENYNYCLGYNKLTDANRYLVYFKRELKTTLHI